jgi:methylmalonyl-CoA mutase cobalamin-binding subunit
VYLGYVGAAARKLGDDWDNDRLTFGEVTVGSGHLYALMRAMKAEDPPERSGADPRRYALFATLPRETHGIGITVAAEVFRQSGWEIDLQIGRDHDEILSIVEQTRAQVIGLSLSTEERLQDLIRLVLALRIIAPGAIIGVATGDAFDDAKIVMFADIDLVFADAPTACADLERLLRARA